MRRLPPPPVVAGSLSGFVIGVVVTLLATGAISSRSASPSATATSGRAPVLAPDSVMMARVRRLVTRQLGLAYPDVRKPRLQSLELFPAGPLILGTDSSSRVSTFRSVFIRFRLNDHPLGRTLRFRAAQADVFQTLKALYTSPLPIYNVEMDGTFPFHRANGVQEKVVLRAIMDHGTAQHVAWSQWGRARETRFWRLLAYTSVNRQFA